MGQLRSRKRSFPPMLCVLSKAGALREEATARIPCRGGQHLDVPYIGNGCSHLITFPSPTPLPNCAFHSLWTCSSARPPTQPDLLPGARVAYPACPGQSQKCRILVVGSVASAAVTRQAGHAYGGRQRHFLFGLAAVQRGNTEFSAFKSQ